jgi:hypothetical protein
VVVDFGNMEEKFKCEGKNCGHEWPLKQEAHPYLCHKCGFDSETHTYNFPALDAWKKSQTAKGEKPYIEERTDNIIRRTFSESVDEHELTWHRDKSDRIVKLLSETDWMIQFDNELPRKMSINETIEIPKNVYHRVIKGTGNLMVEITETDDVNEEEMIDEISCWVGYHKEGTKISDKTGKRVNNCVKTKKKKKSLKESVWEVNPIMLLKK